MGPKAPWTPTLGFCGSARCPCKLSTCCACDQNCKASARGNISCHWQRIVPLERNRARLAARHGNTMRVSSRPLNLKRAAWDVTVAAASQQRASLVAATAFTPHVSLSLSFSLSLFPSHGASPHAWCTLSFALAQYSSDRGAPIWATARIDGFRTRPTSRTIDNHASNCAHTGPAA